MNRGSERSNVSLASHLDGQVLLDAASHLDLKDRGGEVALINTLVLSVWLLLGGR